MEDPLCSMYVDLADIGGPSSHILKSSVMNYEAGNLHKLALRLGDGKVFFDIGANIGHYSIRLGKKFPKTKIFAFEPHGFSFHLLQKNIECHGLSHVRAFNIGLADKPGELRFYENSRNSGGHSFVKNTENKELKESVKIPIQTVDAFCAAEKIKKVDVMKIDVEGFEYSVLLGARSIIERDHPHILFEYTPYLYEKQGYKRDDILRFLEERGYSFEDCDLSMTFKSSIDLSKSLGARLYANILAIPI